MGEQGGAFTSKWKNTSKGLGLFTPTVEKVLSITDIKCCVAKRSSCAFCNNNERVGRFLPGPSSFLPNDVVNAPMPKLQVSFAHY